MVYLDQQRWNELRESFEMFVERSEYTTYSPPHLKRLIGAARFFFNDKLLLDELVDRKICQPVVLAAVVAIDYLGYLHPQLAPPSVQGGIHVVNNNGDRNKKAAEKEITVVVPDIAIAPPNLFWILEKSESFAVTTMNELLNRFDVQSLSKLKNEHGQRAVDIASAACKQQITSRLYFFKRYELESGSSDAFHRSDNSAIFFAVDHENSMKKVALKMFKQKYRFERQIAIREKALFNPLYVLAMLGSHSADTDPLFEAACLKTENFASFRYCIVLERYVFFSN